MRSIRTILLGAVLGWAIGPGISAAAPPPPPTPTSSLAYVAHGKAYLRPVAGGPATTYAVPWKVEGIATSVEGSRLALAGARGQIAVVRLDTGHITYLPVGRWRGGAYASPIWSPDGRYLAYLSGGGPNMITLSVWDAHTGTVRVISRTVPTVFEVVSWSHNSTRLAITTGRADTMKFPVVNPTLEIVSPRGAVLHRVGAFGDVSWSPDDLYLGAFRYISCGANTCSFKEYSVPATGGAPYLLMKDASSEFVSHDWAMRPGGYAFDRWILNAAGHPVRRLLTPSQRLARWSRDGSLAAVQDIYPYTAAKPKLRIMTPAGASTVIHVSPRTADCGMCSKVYYDTAWNSTASELAFISPDIFRAPNTFLLGHVYLYPVAAGKAFVLPVPHRQNTVLSLVGFALGDNDLLIQSDSTVYRYNLASHAVRALSTIATGVAMDTAILVPAR